MQQSTWLITGISSGLGKALAQIVIEKGDLVIGTFRQQQQVDAFTATHNGQHHAYVLDITDEEGTKVVVQDINKRFGRIDVLVNNAGFGFAGAVEEASLDEVRTVMEANFFGTLHLTQTVLPILRAQGRGHIVQISSHGGIKAFPGFGIYNASKFALEGFSEALAAEVAPLGIHVTMVEPGPFRTAFADTGFQSAARKIADYDTTAGAFRQLITKVNGSQEGDPQKAAEAIYHISTLATPPLRLPLGKVPLTTIQAKLDSVQADLDAWRELAAGAVFE